MICAHDLGWIFFIKRNMDCILSNLLCAISKEEKSVTDKYSTLSLWKVQIRWKKKNAKLSLGCIVPE